MKMPSITKRVLPFLLTLIVGIVLGLSLNFLRYAPFSSKMERHNPVRVAPIIHSVPKRDYFDTGKYTNGFIAGEMLSVTLGADGNVSNVVPVSILPTGVANNYGASGKAIINDKLVDSLPYTENTIRTLKEIKFTPATINGKSVSTQISVTVFYNLPHSPDSSITTTITETNSVEVIWQETYPVAPFAYR